MNLRLIQGVEALLVHHLQPNTKAKQESDFNQNIMVFFWLSSLLARAHTIKLWRSGVSEVRTPIPAYNMRYPYQPS